MLISRKEELADGVTLYLGDCRDVLPILPRADAVVTDPPYGNDTPYESFIDTPANVAALVAEAVPLMRDRSTRVALTCGVPNLWKYPPADWVLNWTDPSGEGGCVWGFPSWQPILVYGPDPFLAAGLGRRSDTAVKRYLREAVDHPCPKPTGFMKWLVERTSFVGQTILDPFMGSGTTGVAAVNLGRRFVGIEIEPKYFAVAAKRISEALKQTDLFIEKPARVKPMEQYAQN